MIYDVAIIGGGPAGVAAGVYAARKQLKTIFITKEWGGQSVVSPDIQNWIGIPSISGAKLAEDLKKHLETYAGDVVDIKEGCYATEIKPTDSGFTVGTDEGNKYSAKTVILANGAKRRKLEVPGAEAFDQKGLTYCATCDGPLFTGMDVVVVGGGNAGFETAAQLLQYTKSVTLLEHGDAFKADPVTVKKVLEHPDMHSMLNTDITEVFGDTMVKGVRVKNNKTNEESKLDIGGVFIEIGLVPNTDIVKDLVTLDRYGRVEVNPLSQRTSLDGLWAAGDNTTGLYHQNNIAVGDAVKALEDVYVYLHAS
jgi:alkyl hydroperoxide reductase subunit F